MGRGAPAISDSVFHLPIHVIHAMEPARPLTTPARLCASDSDVHESLSLALSLGLSHRKRSVAGLEVMLWLVKRLRSRAIEAALGPLAPPLVPFTPSFAV